MQVKMNIERQYYCGDTCKCNAHCNASSPGFNPNGSYESHQDGEQKHRNAKQEKGDFSDDYSQRTVTENIPDRVFRLGERLVLEPSDACKDAEEADKP